MEALILAVAPFVNTFLTNLIKPRSKEWKVTGFNKVVTRFLVAFLSFATVILTSVLVDGDIDVVSIETFGYALLEFLAASGIYFLGKKSKK